MGLYYFEYLLNIIKKGIVIKHLQINRKINTIPKYLPIYSKNYYIYRKLEVHKKTNIAENIKF